MISLIASGADFNAVGEDGFTPLHEAYSNGNRQIIDLLLEKGTNTFTDNVRENFQLTCMRAKG